MWVVGTGPGEYASIESAVSNVYAVRGTNVFTVPAVVGVRVSAYTNAVAISTNLGRLYPAPDCPLIIRSVRGIKVTLSDKVDVTGTSYTPDGAHEEPRREPFQGEREGDHGKDLGRQPR